MQTFSSSRVVECRSLLLLSQLNADVFSFLHCRIQMPSSFITIECRRFLLLALSNAEAFFFFHHYEMLTPFTLLNVGKAMINSAAYCADIRLQPRLTS